MENIIEFDEKYAPSNSSLKLKDDNSDFDYLVIVVHSVGSDDTSLSIVPDIEMYRDLIKENNITVVAKGTSSISIQNLIYGLNHSDRILYKNFVQDIKKFYKENVENRFEEDDKFFRNELNSIITKNLSPEDQ